MLNRKTDGRKAQKKKGKNIRFVFSEKKQEIKIKNKNTRKL
jgi:hypothetical protein